MPALRCGDTVCLAYRGREEAVEVARGVHCEVWIYAMEGWVMTMPYKRQFQIVDFSMLTEKEYSAKRRFETSHQKHKLEVAAGGQFTYHITPMAIGSIVIVECNACRKQKDITEYGAW